MKAIPYHLASLLVLAGAVAFAQPAPTAPATSATAKAPARGPKVHVLTVTPASQPSPALKYSLFPIEPEMMRGNAAVEYLKIHVQSDNSDQLRELADAKLEEFSPDVVRPIVERFRTQFEDAAYAARMRSCDWQFHFEEGITMQLVPLIPYRDLGRALALQARLDASEGNFDLAIDRLRSGYAMARNIGAGQLLICGLVGISMQDTMTAEAENLIRAGGPNLYWALARIPSPLLNISTGLDWERQMVYSEFPRLRELRKGHVTAENARLFAQEFEKAWQWLSTLTISGREDVTKGWTAVVMVMKYYQEGKKQLADRGIQPKNIEAMPALAVAGIAMLDQYDQVCDEMLKWNALPYWQAAPGFEQASRILQTVYTETQNPFIGIIPSLHRTLFISARSQRRLAGVQVIEAVRAYAAAHEGKLPESLDQVTDTPPPIDPITGKPFKYTASGQSFTLDATAGVEPGDGDIYQVTMESR